METVKLKTSELTGAALDWAVAKATNAWEFMHKIHWTMTLDSRFDDIYVANGSVILKPRNPMRQDPQEFRPTYDWQIFGLLAKDNLPMLYPIDVGKYQCIIRGLNKTELATGDGILEAFCRCLVMLKLGDEVEVPGELLS